MDIGEVGGVPTSAGGAMTVITIWQWKDLNEEHMVEAMGAVAVLDYPEGYRNYVFADGSGGVSISPDDTLENESIRAHVFSKWCTLSVHRAMTEGEALVLGPRIVEILQGLSAD
jgi:hypothetical protein